MKFDIPCKNCILFAMCRSQLHPVFHGYVVLSNKCSILRKFLNQYNNKTFLARNKTFLTLDDKLKELFGEKYRKVI